MRSAKATRHSMSVRSTVVYSTNQPTMMVSEGELRVFEVHAHATDIVRFSLTGALGHVAQHLIQEETLKTKNTHRAPKINKAYKSIYSNAAVQAM